MALDFYHHICNTCLSTPWATEGNPVKFPKCSGCKMVSYCSPSHQKSDWTKHKRLCMEIQTFCGLDKRDNVFSYLSEFSAQSLYNYQTYLISYLGIKLGRDLTIPERNMIYFPDICSQCLKPNDRSFIYCDKCKLQFYCTEEHKETHLKLHEKECEDLKLNFNLFGVISNDMEKALIAQRELSEERLPLVAFPETIADYLCRIMKCHNMSNSYKILFSDELSYLLTLVYAIRECENKDKPELTIHILGATHIETNVLSLLHIFFHWLPHVQQLHLVLVGPDCPPSDDGLIDYVQQSHRDKKIIIAFYTGVYHEYVNIHNASCVVKPPDILVAFNCGFHEFRGQACDTWETTINFVLTLRGVILITTSYTAEESKEDSQSFTEKADTIKFCALNPYRSLNPKRNSDRSTATYFINGYLSIYRIQ